LSEPKELRDLGPAGRKLHREVVADLAEMGLAHDSRESTMLFTACRMRDRIALLERELADQPLSVVSHTGKGQVMNPLWIELRQTEALLMQTLSRLKPPQDDDSSGVGVPRSVAARSAANARWGKVKCVPAAAAGMGRRCVTIC
jgi:hypothetical protein